MGKASKEKQKKTAQQSSCSLPHPNGKFDKKYDATLASPKGQAKRCGRCRKWVPIT